MTRHSTWCGGNASTHRGGIRLRPAFPWPHCCAAANPLDLLLTGLVPPLLCRLWSAYTAVAAAVSLLHRRRIWLCLCLRPAATAGPASGRLRPAVGPACPDGSPAGGFIHPAGCHHPRRSSWGLRRTRCGRLWRWVWLSCCGCRRWRRQHPLRQRSPAAGRLPSHSDRAGEPGSGLVPGNAF